MALRLRSDPEPVVTIPPITEDAEHQRLSAQLNLLRRALERRTDEQERMACEFELLRTSLPHSQGKTRARDRIAAIDAKAKARGAESPLEQTDGLDPIVKLGLLLASGAALPPAVDRQARIFKLREEVSHLNAAIRVVAGQLDVVREDLSEALCRSLVSQHRTILSSKLTAALALAAAARSESEFIGQILLSGHHFYPQILQSPPLSQASDLGDIADMNSIIWRYRDAVEGGDVFTDAPIKTGPQQKARR